jgi:1,4-dihydroxy-2-naphthoate octaprenyltransferase
MAMMLTFEIPDLGSDAAAGKRVVAVRIGRRRTVRLVAALLALAGFTAVEAVAAGVLDRAAWLWLAPALVTGVATGALARTDRWGWMTASGVATFVAAGAGLTSAVLSG